MLSLIAMARTYGLRPSAALDIADPYTAWCLDEACAYMQVMIDGKKRPIWRDAGGSNNEDVVAMLRERGMGQ